MEVGNPIRDDKGNVPEISSSSPDWNRWFGLNVNADRVPVDSDFYAGFDMDCRDKQTEPITEAGFFDEMDWSIRHAWYRWTKLWRGFIPIKDGENQLPCPEFLDPDEPTPAIQSMRGLWYIPFQHATSLANRLDTLEDIVAKCSFFDLGDGSLIIRPPFFENQLLSSQYFETVEELQRKAAEVRRAIADRMGWLAWFRASIPQILLEKKLPPETLDRLFHETRVEYKRRGYLLRLSDCWAEANILLWLSNSLPLFYCWKIDERLLPQLARINPTLIAADTSEGRVSSYEVDEDEDTLEAARGSFEYDDFFQKKTPDPFDYDRSFEIDAELYVIDFQGWGRRKLPASADPGVYATRFFFKTMNGEGDDTTSVVFWRWRKKRVSTLDRADALQAAEMNESYLREVYKDSYAPRPKRLFDEESGLPLPADGDSYIEPFADHRRDPSDTYSPDQSETSSFSSQDSIPDLQEPPSLFERLGLRRTETSSNRTPFTTVANVTSWRHAARREEEINSRGRARVISDNAPRRSSRSRSPRRPLAGNLAPHARPIALFRQKLRDIAHYIVHDEFEALLPRTIDWNPVLLSKGFLLITEPRSEIRIRYYANSFNHGIRNVGPLLKRAVEKRLAFRIAIKEADLSSFWPASVSFEDRVMGNYIYSPNFVEPTLEPRSPTILAATYIARVGELLKRPHAAAFIGLGGACSWLAQRWGGDGLVARFMQGPSIQTTIFRKGASDIQARNPKGLLWDEITGNDLNLLFGYIPDPAPNSSINDRWLYPPPHIIDECCDNWTGEWNEVMEKIYSYLTDEITKVPCLATPKSYGAWKRWLRTYNGGSYAPVNLLTERHVADVMKGLALAELPRTWNERPLSWIYLPESPD